MFDMILRAVYNADMPRFVTQCSPALHRLLACTLLWTVLLAALLAAPLAAQARRELGATTIHREPKGLLLARTVAASQALWSTCRGTRNRHLSITRLAERWPSVVPAVDSFAVASSSRPFSTQARIRAPATRGLSRRTMRRICRIAEACREQIATNRTAAPETVGNSLLSNVEAAARATR